MNGTKESVEELVSTLNAASLHDDTGKSKIESGTVAD